MTKTPVQLQQQARRQRTTHRLKSLIGFLIFFVVFVAVWQLATTGYDDGGLAPTPRASWHRLVELLSTVFVYTPPNGVGLVFQLLASLQRVLMGFILAAGVAIPLGILLGSHRVSIDA